METTETRSQLRGTCLFCGKTYVVNGDRIGHHGFTISNGNGRYFGFRAGSCITTGMVAHELSNEQAIQLVAAWEDALVKEEKLLSIGKSYDFRVDSAKASLATARAILANWAPQPLKTVNVAKAQAFQTRIEKKIAELEGSVKYEQNRLADEAYWARCVPAAKSECKSRIKKLESDIAMHQSVLEVCQSGGDGEQALKSAKNAARIAKAQSRIEFYENAIVRADAKLVKFAAGAGDRDHPHYYEHSSAEWDRKNAVEELRRVEKTLAELLNS